MARTDRDLSPDPREMGRRRFMIAGEHVIFARSNARTPSAATAG